MKDKDSIIQYIQQFNGKIPHKVANEHIYKSKSLLQAWRDHLGLSIEDLSKITGCTEEAIELLEANQVSLADRKKIINQIAVQLQIKPEQIDLCFLLENS